MGDSAKGGVIVVRGEAVGAGVVDKVGDIFVAVVEVVGNFAGCWEKDERPGGDGFRGVPNVGVEKGVVGATKLLDAKVVVVDEALEGFCAILHCPHFDTSAHTVEGHGDHGIAGLPTNGAVFGIIGYRPNAGLGLDEGLISHLAHARGRMYSIVVVLGREVVNRRVLIEVVGGVGFAFGGRAVSHLAYARGRM